MARETIPLIADWLYCPDDRDTFARVETSEKDFQKISLPHTNVELPHHNFFDAEYQFVSWYRRRINLPKRLEGKRLFVDFEGVMTAAEVFVNGKKLAEHKGGFVPFSVDITDHVRFGAKARNVLAVRVDSTERKDIPPFGGTVDYLTFGGIYREVWLRAVEDVAIDTVFARPVDTLKDNRRLEIDVTLDCAAADPDALRLAAELLDEKGKVVAATESPDIFCRKGACELPPLVLDDLATIKLWDIDSPNLYTVRVTLSAGSRPTDAVETRTGFREAVFTDDGRFLLNGRQVKIRGLNRHQNYPYVGPAAPARMQHREAEMLKHELGLNLVRTSHYPQSRHFLDRCDEIGLLVFEEIPGWNHIGNKAWQKVALNDVRQMIVRDRNHPSIILWGVRINESRDNHDFYTKTNELAHRLDITRQTGGVRCFTGSELLEDVYTMNDFIHTGGDIALRDPKVTTELKRTVPYLVTEFNGHMFPTKSFDQEERCVEHALRHARVQNAAAGHPHIAGAIGWCAFDYNTHKEFGSGDRICYHGVCDIFRFPKMAAWFYESQIDPKIRPVLRVASRWKRGENSAGSLDPLVVFSNCDTVELKVGSKKIGPFEPDREGYPHLEHPPFVLTGIGGFWGGRFDDLTAIGRIGKKKVAEQRIAADGVPARFHLWTDDGILAADGADMTRVAVSLTDAYDNVLPFVNHVVVFTVNGPGEIVGENPLGLVGGVGAVYLRAGSKKGKVTIAAMTPRFEPTEVEVMVGG